MMHCTLYSLIELCIVLQYKYMSLSINYNNVDIIVMNVYVIFPIKTSDNNIYIYKIHSFF